MGQLMMINLSKRWRRVDIKNAHDSRNTHSTEKCRAEPTRNNQDAFKKQKSVEGAVKDERKCGVGEI
jgi:hypothetical protein